MVPACFLQLIILLLSFSFSFPSIVYFPSVYQYLTHHLESNYHRHAVSYSCLQCRSSRRVPAPPGFLDPPDAIESKAGSKQEGGTEQEHVVEQEQRPLEDQRQHLGGIGIPSGDRTYVRTNHLPLALRLGAGHVVFCGNERLGS